MVNSALPAMDAGDILLMDNVNTHKGRVQHELQEYCDLIGVILRYLPKYSPELSPIEEMFSKIKYGLKGSGDRDLFDALISAFASVSVEDCLGWTHHAGYVAISARTIAAMSLTVHHYCITLHVQVLLNN